MKDEGILKLASKPSRDCVQKHFNSVQSEWFAIRVSPMYKPPFNFTGILKVRDVQFGSYSDVPGISAFRQVYLGCPFGEVQQDLFLSCLSIGKAYCVLEVLK